MEKMMNDLDAFELEVASALRATGHLFPKTDREMDCFLEHAERVSLPEKYRTPDFLFAEESTPVERTKTKTIDFSGTAQNWAMAARNGKDLPQSILDKMKEDKKNSQKK
jgi:hypothetical protein